PKAPKDLEKHDCLLFGAGLDMARAPWPGVDLEGRRFVSHLARAVSCMHSVDPWATWERALFTSGPVPPRVRV
ncbi:hypothetical protein HK404_17105, partial [Myxococcus xanthus]|nr:hypothetical protein [Myxococcus xanthus]